ncbi:M1 family metallopeptidase [Aeoliella mucimassa]|uniref:Aminopeptidase N n=1 Tax=Aeoliella mucimassa TaxID=2527972 RepID=A0A518AUY9_9BACT|nr:M1 family aminopeptidase [Aeoliella mucimassa]QDU58530.1 Aminopeptidase N [Aeoliella mucimassa]
MLQLRRWTIGWFLAACVLVVPALAEEHEHICRYCGQDHSLMFAAATESGDMGLKYAPDRVVDVKHIKIDVVPDFAKRTVAGTTTLTFAPISKPVEQVTLDAESLDVSNIESSVPLADYVLTDHKLTLLFATPLPVGEDVEVAITYSAEPKQGLYFRTPELGYPEEDTHLWTQGQTHEAPHWFPCFDYPNERSTTEVICTVPKEMVVVSNGKMLSDEVNEQGLKTVHWLQDKPHASYLVCLVAGKFHVLEDKHRDVSLRFFAQPTLAEHAANSFQDTRTIMEFYEAEIGMPFPWDKYDQATIRDFNSGGMENTTITTLTHTTIFSDETENIYSSRNLDAHEMAHQWFGDYVTCEDWAHLWLNEGFATYYTHLYAGHKLGRDEMNYGLWRDAKGRVLPQAEDSKPIVFRGYDNPWEQFDYRAYPKGSWVLHMLRSQLGKDLYRAGIKHYLEENGQSSVVTADLQAAFEEVSGRELDRFFDQWVFGAGTPKLKVRYKWLAKERLALVTVEQTHKVDDNTGLFEIPTTLRFVVDGKPVDHPVTINKEKHDFYVPLDEQPTLVRFDPEFTVLAEVDFDKPDAMVYTQLEAEDDMIGRLMAARVLGKKDNHKSVEALKETLNNDGYYGVRIERPSRSKSSAPTKRLPR